MRKPSLRHPFPSSIVSNFIVLYIEMTAQSTVHNSSFPAIMGQCLVRSIPLFFYVFDSKALLQYYFFLYFFSCPPLLSCPVSLLETALESNRNKDESKSAWFLDLQHAI